MRLTSVAAFAALFGSVVSAQTPARQVSNKGALEADLHYASGTDTWASTNKPAFVALFVVTRTSISQIYPTYAAQAAYPVNTEHRLVSIGQAGPYSPAALGGLYSSSVPGGRTSVGAWPQTLLLVASTSPLRVSSPWSTDLDLNHKLILQHFVDLQTDAGIETIIDMIRPLDPGAEIAYDRADGIPARAAEYLADDGIGSVHSFGPTIINCSLVNPAQFTYNGYSLTPICLNPFPQPPTTPVVPPKDTAKGATPVTPANVNRKVASEKRLITDPDEIRRFLESQIGHRSQATGTGQVSGNAADKQNAQSSSSPDKSAAVNRQQASGPDVKNNTPRPTSTDRPAIRPQPVDRPAPAPARDESPRMSSPPPAPAPAPAPAQAAPITKP